MISKMKWVSTSLALTLNSGFLATAVHAAPQQFEGTWVNTNSNAQGITRLVITPLDNDRLSIQVFGQCTPTDCDWGSTLLTTYGENVSDFDHTQGTALYQKGFADTLLTLQLRGSGRNRISLKSFTEFQDSSGRQNYASQGTFRRSATASLPEDCVAFNSDTATVTQRGGQWKIVDGNHSMFAFGNNALEAFHALSVIKHYGMSQSCFVGRPGPSFKYLLTNNAAPSGSMPGEDCVSFNPATTTVSQINGRWKIVDGNHLMFDFENNEQEARQSLAVIKKYQFNRSCYVGRPDPSFSYLRR